MRKTRKRTVLWVVVVIVVAVVSALGVWWVRGRAQSAREERTAIVRRGTVRAVVSASGRIEPAARVGLTFEAAGPVSEVLVEVGDVVRAGDVLARQDTARLALQVEQARAGLAAAEARLAQLRAGPRVEEIAIAEANLRAAEAQVSAALAERNRLLSGPDQAALAAAEAELATATAQQKAAEQAHNMTMKCVTFKRPDGEEQTICPALGPIEEQARYNLEVADKALAAARARYEELLAGVDSAAVRAATANVAAAIAQRDRAQAQLDQLRAGVSANEITAAEAQVRQAQAAVEQATLALEQAVLRAPFDGVVAEVNVAPGAFASPGRPAIVVVDPSSFHVTIGVDELDVARLHVGQAAQVTVDAFPDVTLAGQVERISPGATLESGVVTYRVTVNLAPSERPIRADMSATVTIVTEERKDVLVLPTWAVRIDRTTGQPYVQRRQGNRLERVDVTLGIREEGFVEVVSGLAEGDEVVWTSNGNQWFQFGR